MIIESTLIASWHISEYMADCPQSWADFVYHMQEIHNKKPRDGVSVEQLNDGLRKYKARYIENGRTARLDFYDESCYTLFLLAYGGNE